MKKLFLGWRALPFPNYIAALAALGAQIERSEPERCDALLLPGGGDVHPRFFGQDIDGARDIDEARDEYELALFRRFFDAGKPILGICRGLQLIDVALGGTLRQHVEGHAQIGGADAVHAVSAEDAALRALYGGSFSVNSAHHQTVDRLGAGLRAAARADDGVVEALRHDARPVFAVQWHPERLGQDGQRLLAAFWQVVQAS